MQRVILHHFYRVSTSKIYIQEPLNEGGKNNDAKLTAVCIRLSGRGPLRERAEPLRTPLFAPGGAFSALSQGAQDRLKQEAATLAEVFQRSSSHVEGRNGYLSLRNHALPTSPSPTRTRTMPHPTSDHCSARRALFLFLGRCGWIHQCS